MASTAMDIRSLQMMAEGGDMRIPTDSGMGGLYKPFATGEYGGRIATLETLYDFFINNVPDPDLAMAQDPNFDEKIRQQPDVHACMRLRELTVASMPRRIEPSKERGIDLDLAQKVADYVDDVFKGLPNPSELYRQMQMAVLMGGVGFEWIWERVNGYERPVMANQIHKSRFVFDRLGNMAILTRTNPVWGAYVGRDPTRMPNGEAAWLTPGGKFMYHKYMAEGGPWYRPASEGFNYWGRGEDGNLYVPVTFDNFVVRFRLKWIEKHGMPLTILYHPDNQAMSSEVTRIANSLRGESIVTIPRPVGENTAEYMYKLDFIDPPSNGYDAFQEFSEKWTRPAVEKILLGGANLLEVGDRGSYAATVAQRDAGASIIFRYDALKLDETLNIQLIPYIVNARWPGIPRAYYPKHTMAPEEEVDQELRMRLIQQAAEMVPVRRTDVYSAAGLERPMQNEMKDVVYLGQAPIPGHPELGPQPEPGEMGAMMGNQPQPGQPQMGQKPQPQGGKSNDIRRGQPGKTGRLQASGRRGENNARQPMGGRQTTSIA